ncbi:MAG: sigma-54 dependent transcriptional regulator [Planctomycetia bacterium]|nr:sigma-54 dependent transcriptional regulator [Planctomycetia bacterium]
MDEKLSILFVDDDRHVLESSVEWLRSFGHSVFAASSRQEALALVDKTSLDAAFIDFRLGAESGLDLLREIHKKSPTLPVAMLSGCATIEIAMSAVHAGAVDFLTKPLLDNKIFDVLKRVAQSKTTRTSQKINAFRHAMAGATKCPIISQNAQMLRVLEMVDRIADTRATILITGESGTGKSMIAREIHARSRRCDKPLVEVACGALPEALLESELFGHAAGAFTGATGEKIGRFRQADGGSIFLDEIGTASPALQIKLLRVLQEFEFEPVGSVKTQRVDTRVLLATNEDLSKLTSQKRFREDLFYRINVINIEVPPLRTRLEDVAPLASFFLQKVCEENDREIEGFSEAALERMRQYSWPGNVRELQNVVEQSALLSKNQILRPEDLPARLRLREGVGRSVEMRDAHTLREDFDAPSFSSAASETQAARSATLKESLQTPERQIILDALEAHQGSRTKAAQYLGINRVTLYKKMKKLQLL